jgi:hypothetical protein
MLMRRISFPYIVAAAREIGVTRVCLWYALIGRNSSLPLVKKYFDFAAPRILGELPLPELPAGTRIELPEGTDKEAVLAAMKDFARPGEGGAIVIISPLRFAPWRPVAKEEAAPRSKARRRRRKRGTRRGKGL